MALLAKSRALLMVYRALLGADIGLIWRNMIESRALLAEIGLFWWNTGLV